jgi:lipase maturation factor 1
MDRFMPSFVRWFAEPGPHGARGRLLPRWLFLRAMGVIYFSAFLSLLFQIRGLIGPEGLLPAGMYLKAVARDLHGLRFWYAPTLLWLSSSNHALMALCWVGLIASLLLILNLWPREMLAICWVLFLSFVAAAQDFSGYQSDGMLLSAGLICLFFAPGGFRPQWGESRPPSRGSRFLLQVVWFTIYFESGLAKYFGGDQSWRNFTAMDQYYQNGPLPTWIGWYAAQLPHRFQAGTAVFTIIVELGLVWLAFLPRPFRIFCFWVVTFLQVGIILTANYAFLNYLVLALGFLLLDDRYLLKFLPRGWAQPVRAKLEISPPPEENEAIVDLNVSAENEPKQGLTLILPNEPAGNRDTVNWMKQAQRFAFSAYIWIAAIVLAWLLYANVDIVLARVLGATPLPGEPVAALEPFRVANPYGLFGRMTWRRYEIEFQGSDDGVHWSTYSFRFKPQDPAKAPGIYAPYQPRFEWNLWFASLGTWQDNTWVVRAEQLLLTNDKYVLALFASNPYPNQPPRQVRAVLWQYWFTNMAEKRATGMWWRREYLGLYAPSLELDPHGKFTVTGFPESYPLP